MTKTFRLPRLAEPLSPFEVTVSGAWGLEEEEPHDPRAATGSEPAIRPTDALIRAVLPALQRSPCLVSFSGGRDSSLVLAAAVEAARRHGLPEPVPVTLRFEDRASHEVEWQELAVAHLQVGDWLRLEIGDELDFVGPVSQAAYDAHGLQFPGNAYCHVPMLDAARGGSLLAGDGGDHILGPWRWRAVPRTRGARLKRAAALAAPAALRAAAGSRLAGEAPGPHHLTGAARRRLRHIEAAEALREPGTWRERVRWQARRRSLRLSNRSLRRLAGARDVLFTAPLVDPAVLEAIGAYGDLGGVRTRTEAMRLFSVLLPADLIERRTKATFARALWGAASRHAAGSALEGASLPDEVDREQLARLWTGNEVDTRSALLLQALHFGARNPLRT